MCVFCACVCVCVRVSVCVCVCVCVCVFYLRVLRVTSLSSLVEDQLIYMLHILVNKLTCVQVLPQGFCEDGDRP